jgi:hypothetical protein
VEAFKVPTTSSLTVPKSFLSSHALMLIQRSDSILSLRKQEMDNFLRAAKLTVAIIKADFINFKIRVRVNAFNLYKLKCPLVCVKP